MIERTKRRVNLILRKWKLLPISGTRAPPYATAAAAVGVVAPVAVENYREERSKLSAQRRKDRARLAREAAGQARRHGVCVLFVSRLSDIGKGHITRKACDAVSDEDDVQYVIIQHRQVYEPEGPVYSGLPDGSILVHQWEPMGFLARSYPPYRAPPSKQSTAPAFVVYCAFCPVYLCNMCAPEGVLHQ